MGNQAPRRKGLRYHLPHRPCSVVSLLRVYAKDNARLMHKDFYYAIIYGNKKMGNNPNVHQ